MTEVRPGETVRIVVGYSEVCCFMGVAGREMDVMLTDTPYPMAQLLEDDGRPFSFPIGPREAGLRWDTIQDRYFAITEVDGG